MTIEVEIAGTGQIAEFPDGTPQDVIVNALSQLQATEPDIDAVGRGFDETLRAVGSGIGRTIAGGVVGAIAAPFDADVAADIVRANQEAIFQPQTQEGRENIATIGQLIEKGIDIANFPLSGLGGLAELVSGQGVDQAVETVKNIQSEGISKTAGERVFQETGSPAAATFAETLPTAVAELAGLKGGGAAIRGAGRAAAPVTEAAGEIATGLFKFQSPAKQRIAQLIEAGSTDVETAGFRLEAPAAERVLPKTKLGQALNIGGPRVAKDTLAAETLRQGFDEGVIAAVKGSTRADKIAFRKMVNIMERGKKNARFAATNRPSDVAGETLLNKVKVIRNANRAAGKNIDVVARSLKGKPVDLLDAVNSFSQSLDDLGVRLVDDGKGGFKPDFQTSQLSPGDRGPIKEVIRNMNLAGRGEIDGLSAHKMKRIIDNNVTFGKVKTGLSGDAERALKGFRASIDTALDGTFPKYDKANVAYADTINALNALQDSVGKKLNFSGENADKALGTSLRGILSNNKSRINLLDSIGELEAAARKHGAGDKLLIEGKGLGSNDLLSQILFVDELDRRFGAVARTSFQGQVQQGVEAAARGRQGVADIAVKAGAAAAEKLRGINDEGAFKAIKKLLRE